MQIKAEIEIKDDMHALAEAGAQHFIRLAQAAISAHGRFSVALSGGSTPRELFAVLAEPSFLERVEWTRVCFFWGDERCVPPDDRDSNYRLACETLLEHIPFTPELVFRIEAERGSTAAAELYEQRLRAFFGESAPPRLDLALLGLGDDGHTASLFPGSHGLRERQHWVIGVEHSSPPLPMVDRVTLTPLVLNAAANILFLVAGASKAARLAQVLRGPYQPLALPAQGIRPVDGRILWLIDRAAAAGLKE
jgi:6-phosphogluconolactonase